MELCARARLQSECDGNPITSPLSVSDRYIEEHDHSIIPQNPRLGSTWVLC